MAHSSRAAAKAGPAAGHQYSAIFEQAVAFVLADRIEGGYVNDPRDPGGETNFGISKRAYPGENIRELTRAGAISIYHRDYWQACACDALPPALGVATFDCAVNQGTGVAVRLLQTALRVKADGIVGPRTLAAAQAADVFEVLMDLLSWRLRRYAFTANASVYMRGWSKRVLYLLHFLMNQVEVG